MLSEPFLSQQLELADQQVKTWRRIDPRQNPLLSKKLMRAHRKAALEIKQQTNQIQFVNRLSFNPTGIELRIVKMWGQKINGLVETDYAIFCKEWEEIQGNKRTAVFVRAVSAQLLRMIKHWGDSAAHGAVIHRRRTGIDKSKIHRSYGRLTRKLYEDWKERLEIEAGDLNKQETIQARANVEPSLPSSVVPIAVPSKKPTSKLPQKRFNLSEYLEGARLTDRQHQCASWRLEYGLPVTEIARRLGITRRTVDEHIAAATRKIEEARARTKHLKDKAKSGTR